MNCALAERESLQLGAAQAVDGPWRMHDVTLATRASAISTVPPETGCVDGSTSARTPEERSTGRRAEPRTASLAARGPCMRA